MQGDWHQEEWGAVGGHGTTRDPGVPTAERFQPASSDADLQQDPGREKTGRSTRAFGMCVVGVGTRARHARLG